jgi:hypothetical protein
LVEVASLEVHSNGHSKGALPRAVAGLHVEGIVESAGETVEALGIADMEEAVAGVVRIVLRDTAVAVGAVEPPGKYSAQELVSWLVTSSQLRPLLRSSSSGQRKLKELALAEPPIA